MPFVSNMDDEQQKQDPNAPVQGAVSPTGSGSGAVQLAPSAAVPTAGGGSTGPGKAPNTAGGSFASLDKYLGANQGQAAPLAGQLTSSIGKEYSAQDAANNAAIANINSQVTSAPGYTPSDPNVMAAETANPVSFASDPNNVKQFQSLLQNSYGGPASAESTTDYTGRQNAINSAIATGKTNTTTEAGRENLLSQNEATPTTGVTALNSAILSQDPNALSSVQNAYVPFNNLLTNLQTGAQGVNATIGKEQNDAANSSKAANDAISSQINGVNTGVTGALTAAQQKATAQNAQLKTDLTAGTPSADDLKLLGMNSDQWNALSGAQKAAATAQTVQSNQGQFGATSGTTNVDLTNFLTAQDPNVAYTTANVATPEQYQQTQAFQTLLKGLNLGTPASVLNPATASQAGTAPTNPNSFDYQTALSTAQNASAQEKAAAQAYVDSLQSGADEDHAQANAAAAAQRLGVSSAILPGLAGSVPATIKQTENLISHPSIKNLGSSIENVFNAENASAKAGLNTVVNTVKNIFCFHPDTQVEMANGGTKAICKIEIGDDTKGGRVIATTRGLGQGFYWYFGVLVTGKHAVKEDGVWVRVENSKNGREFKYLTEVVCNLVTDKHRIWANGVEFADEHENDNYENLNLQESLDALNNQ